MILFKGPKQIILLILLLILVMIRIRIIRMRLKVLILQVPSAINTASKTAPWTDDWGNHLSNMKTQCSLHK